MASITTVRAWANNEVAYIAWDTDGTIPGCLDFEVTRAYLDATGNVALRPDGSPDRVKCAVSSAQAMPNYVAAKKDRDTDEVIEEGDSPTTSAS